ncbi:hypothetical protein NMY22_g15022 [Coprinellus aureogranulatus]|nr:hypothetical protein NMY22_g15022 [Coprinellus aureogranulatus]
MPAAPSPPEILEISDSEEDVESQQEGGSLDGEGPFEMRVAYIEVDDSENDSQGDGSMEEDDGDAWELSSGEDIAIPQMNSPGVPLSGLPPQTTRDNNSGPGDTSDFVQYSEPSDRSGSLNWWPDVSSCPQDVTMRQAQSPPPVGSGRSDGRLPSSSTSLRLTERFSNTIPPMDAVAAVREVLHQHRSDMLWIQTRLRSHHRNIIRCRYLAEKTSQAISRALYIQGKGQEVIGSEL